MSTSCSLLRTAFPTHPLQRSGAELAGAPAVPAAVRGGAGGAGTPLPSRAQSPQPVPLCSFATGTPAAVGRSRGHPHVSWGAGAAPAPTSLLPRSLPRAGWGWLCSQPAGNPTVSPLRGQREREGLLVLQSDRVGSCASSWAANRLWARAVHGEDTSPQSGGALGIPGCV